MSGSRDGILGRIRAALNDVQTSDPVVDVPVEWGYGRPTEMADVVARFAETVADYQASVTECEASEVADRVAGLLGEGVRTLVVPDGIDPAWTAGLRADMCRDEPMMSPDELDEIDAVLTAAAVGIAETGTIVLDHRADQGRRALTLVPDVHVCVVRTDQIVSDVPEAVARLDGSVREGRPLTWISGPSATSDIELDRVEGVHGPRTLHVLIAHR